MNSFKDIKNRNDLADFLKVPRKKLTHVLYVRHVENLYTSFIIPKKSGGERHINAPTDELKSIQQKLATALWEYQKNIWTEKNVHPNISHAFEKEKSILTNAKIHRNKRFILNIDLENYFDSFHFGRVRGFFQKNSNFNLPIEVATIIAQLTCYNKCLPQGSPSSPIITNLICQALDIKILKIAKKYKMDYTRYADDMTFSTNNKHFLTDYPAFVLELSEQIVFSGFKINDKKTRLIYRDSRQEVTGLIVNKKISIDRRYYKSTRAMANRLYCTGALKIDGIEASINQLEGRFSFINQIERYNNEIDNNSHSFRHLCSREEQYRKFIFYKYFIANNTPIIVTEGKTDVVYLKSALKNLSNNYSNLVSHDDSHYDFHISFLNRSKRLRYFFGISQDGADTIKNIYNYYVGRDGFQNYLQYFTEKFSLKPQKPVIFIFDNELANKDKPLSKFANHVGLKDSDKAKLTENLYIKISANLYLLTNPIIKNEKEAEIEDLFDDDTLSHEINGKKLCLSSKFDNSTFYGKEIFSKYISSNYKDINFSGFKRLLDSLNEIISDYDNT